MSYLGRSAKLSLKAQEKVSFLATAGQTVKTGLSYTVGFIEVYVNGVLLTDTTDFTATNGNSVTFTVALLLNDEVTVISLKTFTVADHYNKTEADTLLAAKATIANFTSTGIDDNATSTAITIDSSENVGIGTASPNRQLNVENTLANSGGVIGLTSSDSSTTGSLGIIHFGNSTDTSLASINGIADGSTSAGALLFKTEAAGGSIDERMRIDSSGNVGVGTASPAKPLDVTGDIRTSTGILFGTDTAAANTLDDYEEGVFIPTVRGSTNAGSFSIDSSGHKGRYTKIGDICSLSFVIAGTLSGATGSYTQFNLPFTVKAGTAATGTFSYVLTPNLNHLDFSSYVIAGQTLGYFLIKTGSAATPVYPAPSSFMPAGVQIYGTVTYTVA